MDWYNKLVQGASISLSKLFDPNYYPARGATEQSPYSDSRGMGLHELFYSKQPRLDYQFNDVAPAYEDGWQVNREPAPRGKRFQYTGYL